MTSSDCNYNVLIMAKTEQLTRTCDVSFTCICFFSLVKSIFFNLCVYDSLFCSSMVFIWSSSPPETEPHPHRVKTRLANPWRAPGLDSAHLLGLTTSFLRFQHRPAETSLELLASRNPMRPPVTSGDL